MGALSSDAFCDLLRETAATRPAPGMTAKVVEGKQAGTIGRITWHGRDKFASDRYADEAMRHFRDCRGINGFRVRIEPEDKRRTPFFVDAAKIIYCVGA